jgi:hypothetical protein
MSETQNEPTTATPQYLIVTDDGNGSQYLVDSCDAFGREVRMGGHVLFNDPAKLRAIAADLLARADWLEGKS